MPNWCSNKLEIMGAADDVERLLEAAKPKSGEEMEGETEFSLQALRCVPEELVGVNREHKTNREKSMEQVMADSWAYVNGDYENLDMDLQEQGLVLRCGAVDEHSWRLQYWGTKWDVQAEVTERLAVNGEAYATVVFDSAWGPISPLVAHLAGEFPSLRLKLSFEEGGMDFAGYETWEGGEKVDSEMGNAPLRCWDCGEEMEMREWEEDEDWICAPCEQARAQEATKGPASQQAWA